MGLLLQGPRPGRQDRRLTGRKPLGAIELEVQSPLSSSAAGEESSTDESAAEAPGSGNSPRADASPSSASSGGTLTTAINLSSGSMFMIRTPCVLRPITLMS